MDFEHVLDGRYSCRRFLDKPVSLQQVRDIASVAQRSPSWGNTQPWKLYAVGGEKAGKLKELLVQTMGTPQNPDLDFPDGFSGAMEQRIESLGKAMFEVLGIERQDQEARLQHNINNFSAFGAPVLLFVTVPRPKNVYAVLDAGAYVHALCLAATNLGLATVILTALVRFPDKVREIVPIPESETIVIGVALGYADEQTAINSFRSPREDLDSVLTTLDI